MARPIRTCPDGPALTFSPQAYAADRRPCVDPVHFLPGPRRRRARQGDGSNLDNVRDGHLRAAAAWDALAARSLKADRMRAEEELRKSEVRSADPNA